MFWLFERIVAVDWDSRSMVLGDWALALVALAWGAWSGDPLWIAGGALGGVLAWARPMGRIKAHILRSVRPARGGAGAAR